MGDPVQEARVQAEGFIEAAMVEMTEDCSLISPLEIESDLQILKVNVGRVFDDLSRKLREENGVTVNSFRDWLAMLPPAQQDDVLGAAAAVRFRERGELFGDEAAEIRPLGATELAARLYTARGTDAS